MHSETVAQWRLESDLRHGIEHQEFQLYYQPIINLKTDRIAGFEALVRWISPTRGFVPPGEFIPVSETTGFCAKPVSKCTNGSNSLTAKP